MKPILSVVIFCFIASTAFGQQSSITEAEGASCMGDDKSRKETENAALQDAKRLAIEFSKTHIESETVVENYELKSDLVAAFAKADVKVLDIVNKEWDDPATGDCVLIRIRAEVVPSNAAMQAINTNQMMTDPRAPLNVKLWTNADLYTDGEVMKIYLQGNKPFYARLIYIDAQGNNIQLLPNQHRSDNYFAGGTVFEVPSGEDGFELAVGEPFGREQLVLYASTNPLGGIEMAAAGEDVYLVTEAPQQIATKTRGISIAKPGTAMKRPVIEFAETTVQVTTSAGESI